MSQFEAGVLRYDRSLGRMSSDTIRQTAQMTSGFAQFAQGVATTLAGIGLTRVSQDLAMTASRTQTLGVAMLAVGGNVGFTTTELAIQEENIKKLGITTQVARTNLTRMMQAQIDVTQATKLARVAQDAAVIANVNSSEAFDRILHAVTTLQPEILRNMGIVVNLQQAYDAFAKTQGISVDAMTTTQKQTIALNETIKQGALIAGTYEKAMETPGKALTSLERHIEEAKNALGEALLPAMKTAIDIATEFFKAIQNLPGPLKAVASAILVGGGALGLIMGPLQTAATLWAGFKAATAAAMAVELASAPARMASAAAIGVETAALAAQNAVLVTNQAQLLGAMIGTRGAAAAVGGIGAAAGTATGAATGLVGALGALAPVLIAIGVAAAGVGITLVARDMIKTSENARLATRSIADLNSELAELRTKSEKPVLPTIPTPGGLIFREFQKLLGLDVESKMEAITATQLRSSDFIAKALEKQADGKKQVIKSTLDLATAEMNLIKLQEEYNVSAEKALPATVERLQLAVQMLPDLAPQIQGALEDISARGADAIAKSAMDQMTDAEQKGLKGLRENLLRDLPTIITEAEAKGNAALAAEAKKRLEGLQGPLARAFEIRPQVSLEGIISPEIEAQSRRLADADKAQQTQAKALGRELDQLGLASDRLSIQQMRLGVSMTVAERSLRESQESVRNLADRLSEAKDRLQQFSTAPLVGMKDFDDQLFDLSQSAADLQLQMLEVGDSFAPALAAGRREALQLKLAILEAGDATQSVLAGLDATANQLQSQMLGIQLGFAPGIGSARKEILQLRLAMLEAGEATQKMFQFDLADMQRRELREGVPVARQIFEEIKRVQKGEGAEQKTPQQKQLEESEKNLQILELKQQLALIDLQTQSDIVGMQKRQVELSGDSTAELKSRLQVVEKQLELQEAQKQLALFDLQVGSEALSTEQQRLNLTKQLTFDQQLRDLKDMLTTSKELTFEEAVAGIQQAQQDIEALNGELSIANQIVSDRQAVVDDLRKAQEGLSLASQDNRIKQAEYNLTLSESRVAFGLLREEIEASVKTNQDALTKSLEDLRKMVKDNPIRFDIGTIPPSPVDVSVRPSQIGPQEWAGFAGNPPMSPSMNFDIGGLAGSIGAAIGGAFDSLRGLLGFRYGGVVPGPPGSPQLVMAHGGERITSNNSNWNVTINQQHSGQDVVGQLRREARMIRLTRS